MYLNLNFRLDDKPFTKKMVKIQWNNNKAVIPKMNNLSP